mmetsp:Transcript_28551/g.42015  ORF Transcript_28551/g.42015 Transcript_28551/m.42015 type:complete len:86 (-) Transcript_28551:57-314(-)
MGSCFNSIWITCVGLVATTLVSFSTPVVVDYCEKPKMVHLWGGMVASRERMYHFLTQLTHQFERFTRAFVLTPSKDGSSSQLSVV